MTSTYNISIEDFNYELPDDRIAKFPLPERDMSKLLIYKNKQISESRFRNLHEFIPENALLVFNNTKVIQARLIFQKATGAQIEIFCIEPKEPSDYVMAFSQKQSCIWLCMIGNLKKWKNGKIEIAQQGYRCAAEKIESFGDTHLVRFEWDNQEWNFADILEKCGELPIPPYLNRKTEESDKKTYQTIYSKIKGSVAAPTAGLHFTENVFKSLMEKGIICEELTLHVGAGTFKPVKSKTLLGHTMHSETISVKKDLVEQLIKKAGQIYAVGTTSVRTLESLYYTGAILAKKPDASIEELSTSQWKPYSFSTSLSTVESLTSILNYMENKRLETLTTHTQIMIAPGYTFKIVNGIITNFHQPKSTLLLLVSAFLDGNWREIYDYALTHDFRFLSYGDSSLLCN
ncbi:MAG: S-adenosylmethionine:tRNA ribosyltransferase-isomerase [Dysgonamonadaceae bacterium]|jgi:S-adenosylmethionine:tRNA ribosyltransferase-isomerase|nr:S-adenosylmethionine:tRNA ribosyltransferase-isomerase [Dysgonamonadaceae bacterium]